MSTETPTIPAETARHVLWHWGQPGGAQPGSFTQKLMQAIDSADRINTEMLRVVYPALVGALKSSDPDTVAHLQRIAAGDLPTVPRCSRCGDKDGPFTPAGLCEPCVRPLPLGGVM
jgi:hypothetical protein